jgi:hypothetical protein
MKNEIFRTCFVFSRHFPLSSLPAFASVQAAPLDFISSIMRTFCQTQFKVFLANNVSLFLESLGCLLKIEQRGMERVIVV